MNNKKPPKKLSKLRRIQRAKARQEEFDALSPWEKQKRKSENLARYQQKRS